MHDGKKTKPTKGRNHEMKHKRKFTWMTSIVLACSLVLTACSSGGGTQSPSGGASPSADTSKAKAEEKHEPVTLQFISWKQGTYDELYAKFTQMYPWITIKQVPVNGKKIMEVIAALEAAGTPADATEIDQDMISFDKNGLLEDLTPYIKGSDIFQKSKFPDGFFDMMTVNKKTLAVPMVDVPMWILVNKDLLAKHGVDMPKNDWTYDDFRNIAKKITDPNAGEYGVTTQAEIQMRLLSSKAIADGHADNHHYLNKDFTKSVMNTPDVMNDIRWLQEFVKKDGSMQSNKAADASGKVTRDFINGKTGFAIGGDWLLPTLKQKAPFNWDVLPFPKGKVSQPGYSIYGPLAMLAGSKHKKEAFLWLSFHFTKEAQKWKIDQGANASVLDPEIIAYYDQTPMWKGKNIEAVKIAQKYAKIEPGVAVPLFNEYNWNNILNDVIFGERDINDIIPLTEAWNKKRADLQASVNK
jgi:ABC-type glycerol-3-phosphate transport system substrate-binding protein